MDEVLIKLVRLAESMDFLLILGVIISLPWLIPYLLSPLDPEEREFLREERKRKAREAEEAQKAQEAEEARKAEEERKRQEAERKEMAEHLRTYTPSYTPLYLYDDDDDFNDNLDDDDDDEIFRFNSRDDEREQADLDLMWGMHLDSQIFGTDDYSGFGGFDHDDD